MSKPHAQHVSPRRSFVPAALGLLLLASAGPLAHADVLRVDGALGSAYPTIQSAIDAALDGDTILVEPLPAGQSYAGFVALGKAIDVVGVIGAGGVRPRLEGSIDLRFVPSGATVRLRGLEVHSPDPFFYALQLVDNQGVVMVEDLALSIEDGATGGEIGYSAAAIFDSAQVHLVRVEARGSAGVNDSGPATGGGPALQLVRSNVAVHGCVLVGGDGAIATATAPATDGADAVRQFEGICHFLGSTLEGGDGGGAHFDTTGCSPTGASGSALEIVTTAPSAATAYVAAGAYSAGRAPASGACNPGVAAPLISNVEATVVPLPGGVARAHLPGVVLFGAPFVLAVEAAPGAIVVAGIAGVPSFLPLPTLAAVLAVDPSFGTLVLGVADGTGSLAVPSSIPNLGVPAFELVVQVATLDPASFALSVSNPTAATFVRP